MIKSTPIHKLSLEQFLKQKPVASNTELLRILKTRVAIKRKSDAGVIVSLGSGLYASPSLDPFSAAVIATAKYYSKAVISNLTALVIYKLSDEAINKVDVDIEKTRSLRNRLLYTHRVAKSHLVGITKLDFCKTKIRIYDIERTLCEAYKVDPAGAIFFKALKRYIKFYKPKPDTIRKYDEILKTKVLKHLTQELADA